MVLTEQYVGNSINYFDIKIYHINFWDRQPVHTVEDSVCIKSYRVESIPLPTSRPHCTLFSPGPRVTNSCVYLSR